jgi:hypothetical protein
MTRLFGSLIIIGALFSHAALACEDGPECQDLSPARPSSGEVQSTPFRHGLPVDASYGPASAAAEETSGAKVTAPTQGR